MPPCALAQAFKPDDRNSKGSSASLELHPPSICDMVAAMDSSNDEFTGFGEGFEGFPKRLPEDCVEYSIYVIDSGLKTQKELLARLEAVRKESLKWVGGLAKDYIWQREAFRLEIKREKGTICLYGLTNYGDSVEDEWLIVYILRELSNRYPELWIKVVDTDGEFLLIEAANALPRWLNPEIADNRVWIHSNDLRIIPLRAAPVSSNTKTEPISRPLTLDEALQTIISTPNSLIHSPLIEEEAFYRIRNYPSQITASLHHSLIRIPRKLAYILHDRPGCIAPAVEAFYLRDPIALKPLQSLSSELNFPPVDLVTVSTRFTKVLYAQLKSQQFSAPVAWKPIMLRAETSMEADNAIQKSYSQLEMGMKVTSGFEMLMTDPKNRDNRMVREIRIILDDLAAEDGSGLPTDEDIIKWDGVTREDGESWLDINLEDFERELQGKSEEKKSSTAPGAFGPEPPPGFGDAKTQADLKKMVQRFEAFLNDEDAGVEGAEMDDMDFDEEEEETDEDSEDEDKEVSFDEKEFARMMREMMGMPEEGMEEEEASKNAASKSDISRRVEEVNSDDEVVSLGEAGEIRKVMERMENELNEAGALNLDPTPRKLAAVKENSKGKSKEILDSSEGSEDESEDGEVDIDFNLAKNLLESFKSQAGMAGPGGNLLGMMGMQLPRDEDDIASVNKKA